MNKIFATILVVSASYGLTAVANEQNSSSNLNSQINQLSSTSFANEQNIFDSPAIFIEQEFSQQLAQLKSAPKNLDNNGQWSVSFDLNKFDFETTDWTFNNVESTFNQALEYDWALGTSLVSPNQTSRFFVNYGERKVPISISFDDIANGINQSALGLGIEQKLNESWAVSISYLKTDNELSSLLNDGNNSSIQEHNYSFDFSESNKLETVNFSPLNHRLVQPNFLDDISAINIKVSRKISDDILVSAQASQSSMNFMTSISSELALDQLKAQELSLKGKYNFNDEWSLGADIERQKVFPFEAGDLSGNGNLEKLDSTTLDIGVQYQSDWDKVGVVIRIDLMNLLGVNNLDNGQKALDDGTLKPFSFDTPKYIKVTGSVSF